MIKLKPCPFCGGEAEFYLQESSSMLLYGVCCPDCYFVAAKYGSEEAAADAWNKRVDESEENRNEEKI